MDRKRKEISFTESKAPASDVDEPKSKTSKTETEPDVTSFEVPLEQSRRKRVTGFEDEVVLQIDGDRVSFTIPEKEKLLTAIKRFGPEDYDSVAKFVGTKNAAQVKLFIENKQIRARGFRTANNSRVKIPIEHWLSTAGSLTRDRVDYSCMLAPVMSIAGQFEPRKKRKQVVTPDYKAIYGYLTQLLEGSSPDVKDLQPIDGVVILDLFQGLADHLKSLDLDDQRKIMLAKYKLLHANQPLSTEAREAITRALQQDNDVLDDTTTDSSVHDSSTDSTIPDSDTGPSTSEAGMATNSENQSTTAMSNEPSSNTSETKSPDTGGQSEAKTMNQSDRPVAPEVADLRANKSKLYTLNPFAIDVKYLKPKSKSNAPPTAEPQLPDS